MNIIRYVNVYAGRAAISNGFKIQTSKAKAIKYGARVERVSGDKFLGVNMIAVKIYPLSIKVVMFIPVNQKEVDAFSYFQWVP